MDEIKLLLEIYQFEIVDAAKMKVSDQIQMFSECRYLISIHGAGLTNMIFRRTHPLSILEIVQPSKYIPFHYIMLAHQYGFQYNILLGSEGVSRYQGGCRVDSIQLKKMIESMVNFQCT
jgi:capsular polysaccharide biosynthesis protein